MGLRAAAGGELRDEAHDLRLARREPQHAWPARPDVQRRAWSLHRPRMDLGLAQPIVGTGVRDALAGEQALDQRNGLRQPIDAAARRVVRQAQLAVVGRAPTGAQAQLQPAVGQDVERGRLARHDQWMAEVVGEDVGTDAQAAGHRRRGGERCDRRELVAQVIRHQQRVVAERLRATGEVQPGLAGRGVGDVHGEAKVVHRAAAIRRYPRSRAPAAPR